MGKQSKALWSPVLTYEIFVSGLAKIVSARLHQQIGESTYIYKSSVSLLTIPAACSACRYHCSRLASLQTSEHRFGLRTIGNRSATRFSFLHGRWGHIADLRQSFRPYGLALDLVPPGGALATAFTSKF